jgi:uncharacterized protein
MTLRDVRGFLVSIPRRALVLLVRFYQLVISPWTPPSCRFYPSCSQYAVVALERHGVFRGGWLAVRRVGRCHPWAAGGVDDVPPRVVADGHLPLQHISAHAGHHKH